MGVRNCYGVVGERMEKMKTSYSMNFSLLYAFLSWIVQAQGILFLLLRVVKEMIYDREEGDYGVEKRKHEKARPLVLSCIDVLQILAIHTASAILHLKHRGGVDRK